MPPTAVTARPVRRDIDRDVLRGRGLDLGRKFLPDGLSRTTDLPFLAAAEARLLSQLQGRTHAGVSAWVERFVGDGRTLEALFHRLDAMAAAQGAPGRAFAAAADALAAAVPGAAAWAVLALALARDLRSLAHHRTSIDPDPMLCPLCKDVFRFAWTEASQHAIVDERAWRAEHARLDDAGRDRGVDDLIALVAAVDATVQAQAAADADHFLALLRRRLDDDAETALRRTVLGAYRWQHIGSGVQEPRYARVLQALLTPSQRQRLGAALAPILDTQA